MAGAVALGVGLAPLVWAWTTPSGRATSAMGVQAVPVAVASTVTTTAPATTTTGAVPPTTTTTGRATTTTTRRQRPGPGTMQYFTMPSGDADGRRRQFWLYRPGVAESAELPVVYFLHGYPGNERSMPDSGLPAMLERLFASGVKPFVVVAPNGQSLSRPDTEWTDSRDGTVKLESYIVNRLVPAVEGVHRRDRAHRAVAGFSMGAYGAMNLGLRHPDLFGQIVSIAGYYHVDDPDEMGQRTPEWVAANSPDQHVTAGAASRILLMTASDEYHPLIAGEAQRYQRLAESAGQHPALVVAPGAHTFDLVVTQLPTIARFLADGW
ncbi:MAG TPA: alpha/beta hydrolase-fold protein [Acidimicrobiia bacterium]